MGDTLAYKDVNVHPVAGGWITTAPITYRDLFIPKGFFFNGADIPRLFWRLIPPNDPMILQAVCVHDFVCNKKQYVKADNYYEEIAIQTKVAKWKRKTTVAGIRFYTKWIR